MEYLPKLLRRYGIPLHKDELKALMTHNSFSENNHSRYVFAGQFYFRGLLAKWISKNISGTGTQLQHFLGNIFSTKQLAAYFDKWELKNVRLAEGIDLQAQKHIFVYALLGYISEKASEEMLERFIYTCFIEPNDNLLPHSVKRPNRWQQLIYLTKLYLNGKPALIISTDNGLQTAQILLKNELLATHSSMSYKYARKKTINNALKVILEKIEADGNIKNPVLFQHELSMEREAELQKQQKKVEKQNRHLKRNTDHSFRMLERKLQISKEAMQKEKRRRLAKEEAKKRNDKKPKATNYRAYTPEEIAAMSTAKRRNLQDRGIIS